MSSKSSPRRKATGAATAQRLAATGADVAIEWSLHAEEKSLKRVEAVGITREEVDEAIRFPGLNRKDEWDKDVPDRINRWVRVRAKRLRVVFIVVLEHPATLEIISAMLD